MRRRCLAEAGTRITEAGLVGGGARSAFWARILASVLGLPLTRYAGAAKGPAFGAARLGRLAAGGGAVEDICRRPPVLDVTEPDRELHERYRPRIEAFRRLYGALKPAFADAPPASATAGR